MLPIAVIFTFECASDMEKKSSFENNRVHIGGYFLWIAQMK